MRGVSIEIQGLDKLQARLRAIPRQVVEEIDAEMAATANVFVNGAVADAPLDQGVLKNAITAKREGEMNYTVSSGADWSAYIEFGTKSRARVPSELAAYAAQFKGKKRGGGKGFYDNILEWVKRKGITGTYKVATRRREGSKVDKQIEDEQVAYAIYVSILRHGVRPHPFFFPQLPKATEQFNKKLKTIVKQAIRGAK